MLFGLLSVAAFRSVSADGHCDSPPPVVYIERSTKGCGPDGFLYSEIVEPCPKNGMLPQGRNCIGMCKDKCAMNDACQFYRATGLEDTYTCNYWSECTGEQEFPGITRKTYKKICENVTDPPTDEPTAVPTPDASCTNPQYGLYLARSTCSCGAEGLLDIEPMECPESGRLPDGRHCIAMCKDACTANPECAFYRSSGTGDDYECDIWFECTGKMEFPNDEPRKTYVKLCKENTTETDVACGEELSEEHVCEIFDIPEESQADITSLTVKAKRLVGVKLTGRLIDEAGESTNYAFGDRQKSLGLNVGCKKATQIEICTVAGHAKLESVIIKTDYDHPACELQRKQDEPEVVCTDFTAKASCEKSGCIFYRKKCYDQGFSPPDLVCEELDTRISCEGFGCVFHMKQCHPEGYVPTELECHEYTSRISCEGANCVFHNKECHAEDYTPPVLACSDHPRKPTCLDAGCEFMQGKCYDAGYQLQCADYVVRGDCLAAGCLHEDGDCMDAF